MMPSIGMKSKSAILGGTFDPVHLGHIHLFHNIYMYAHVDTLYVIPALISNFKQDTHPASFQNRLEMLQLAALDYKDLYPEDELELVVSDYEGKKGGVSYTSETIREFFPLISEDGKVNFAFGDDLLKDLDKWHDFEYLKNNVHFICFTRDESDLDTHGADVEFIPSPRFNSSSSAVREGHQELLSPRVLEYVNNEKLYRAL